MVRLISHAFIEYHTDSIHMHETLDNSTKHVRDIKFILNFPQNYSLFAQILLIRNLYLMMILVVLYYLNWELCMR